MSKLLTVFGSTGAQGGSVINSVLEHPKLSKFFKIRGITRDSSKPAAQALSKKGVEVVEANLDDKASLQKALTGAHSVFLVTNFWEKVSKDIEVQQGKNVADICKELDVQHLIWSGLPNVTIMTDGALRNVKHFDGKAEIEYYIRQLGIPMSSYWAGFYMSNFKDILQKGDDNNYTMGIPVPGSTCCPIIDTKKDTGKFVAAILLNPTANLNRTILGAVGYMSFQEIAKVLEASKPGSTVTVQEVPGDIWKLFLPAFMAEEMLENYYLIRDYNYYGDDGEERLAESLKIVQEPLTTFEDFVKREKPLDQVRKH